MLVLAPTRELAMQTAAVVELVGTPCGVESVCVYGGVPKGPQRDAVRGGAQIVVATLRPAAGPGE
jgi:ATP-dependent RNA helicase DBP3